ncbi:MAG TPA: hypothetical protein ENI75_00555 [Mizugakiibacter sp.]|nr:hypothetical protein [Mizugakiibacter sp.]
MSKKSCFKRCRMRVLTGVIACCVPLLALAEYVPFPGKLAVHLLEVQAPNIIFVNFETWPGFLRSVQVILPDTAVPEDTPQADSCEREKAHKALGFTQEFLAAAKKIYVKDMRMNTSADEQAYSEILTDKGSLSQALKKEGLARSESVPADTSWCQ